MKMEEVGSTLGKGNRGCEGQSRAAVCWGPQATGVMRTQRHRAKVTAGFVRHRKAWAFRYRQLKVRTQSQRKAIIKCVFSKVLLIAV